MFFILYVKFHTLPVAKKNYFLPVNFLKKFNILLMSNQNKKSIKIKGLIEKVKLFEIK